MFVRGAYPGSMLLGSPSLIQENEVSVGKAVACAGAIFGVCAVGLVAFAGRKVALRGLETTAAECLCLVYLRRACAIPPTHRLRWVP